MGKKAMAMTCAECPCCCPGHEYSCCYMVSLPVAMTLSITVTTSDEINEPSGVCTRQLMATTQELLPEEAKRMHQLDPQAVAAFAHSVEKHRRMGASSAPHVVLLQTTECLSPFSTVEQGSG